MSHVRLSQPAAILTVAVAVVLLLTACGTIGFGDMRKDTKAKARRADTANQPLEMPPPLVLTREQPNASAQARRAPTPAAPAPLPVARAASGTRGRGDWNAPADGTPGAALPDPGSAVEGSVAGGESVLVEGQVAAVHRQVREFWNQLGVAIARDDVQAGVINTGWIAGYVELLAGRPAGAADGGVGLDRFSVSLTPGTSPATTTVSVRHEGMRERRTAGGGEPSWESRSEPRLEQNTLERLRVFLGG